MSTCEPPVVGLVTVENNKGGAFSQFVAKQVLQAGFSLTCQNPPQHTVSAATFCGCEILEWTNLAMLHRQILKRTFWNWFKRCASFVFPRPSSKSFKRRVNRARVWRAKRQKLIQSQHLLIHWISYSYKRAEDVYVLISIFILFISRNKNMPTL